MTVDLSESTESGAPGQLAYQTLMEEGKIVIQQKTTCEGLLDLEEKRVYVLSVSDQCPGPNWGPPMSLLLIYFMPLLWEMKFRLP